MYIFSASLESSKARPISYSLQASAAHMPFHSPMPSHTFNRLFWGGCLAVGFLWLLALGSLGDQIKHVGSDTGRSGVKVAVDMPLLANGETTLALKRLFKRTHNQSSPEPANHIWLLTASEHIIALPFTIKFQYPTVQSFHFRLRQLLALNSPRAPPLV